MSNSVAAQRSHKVFLAFLFLVATTATVAIWIRNSSYYLLPIGERTLHARYEDLKPSGLESHGYGILGTTMIVVGVIIYSSRKRLRALAMAGNIRTYLQVHIFLCVLGPILVLYHTTFKFGGIISVGFWSMASVVASGIIGRYLYHLVPKNIEGRELSAKELEEERNRLYDLLRTDYALDDSVLKELDAVAVEQIDVRTAGIAALATYLLKSDAARFRHLRTVRVALLRHGVSRSSVREISRAVRKRIVLRQQLLVLERAQQFFHYWHVIHLPFSIIMFVVLAIHIGVAVAFGYTWIF